MILVFSGMVGAVDGEPTLQGAGLSMVYSKPMTEPLIC